VQWLHRRDIKGLVRRTDASFATTPSQAEHLQALHLTAPVQVLLVGTNIRVQFSSAAQQREPRHHRPFRSARLKYQTLRQLKSELKGLAAAERITGIVVMGGGNTSKGDDQDRALLGVCGLKQRFEQRGMFPKAEIWAALSAATFAISAQTKMSLMKSSTFMAYAAHGLNILSPIANPLASEPLCWLTSPAELRTGISAGQLHAQAENLRVWQERTSSWPRIASEFARALQLNAVFPS
jgi:hypothetical protein